MALNAKHRWALTATPYVTGDGARDVASLTFGTVSVFSYSFNTLMANWNDGVFCFRFWVGGSIGGFELGGLSGVA